MALTIARPGLNIEDDYLENEFIIKIKKTLSKNNLNSISRAEDLYLLYEENYKLFETKILLSFKDIKGKENETNNHIELLFSDLELPPIKIIIKTIFNFF